MKNLSHDDSVKSSFTNLKDKLEADLEFHKQKIRLINEELDDKNKKLTNLMEREKNLRKWRDQFRNRTK